VTHPPASPKAAKAKARNRVPPTDLRSVLGDNLRAAREARNISQRDLSSASGVAQAYISRIEKGDVGPGLDVIAELAKHVGRSVASLLTPPRNRRS
jgi:transcriptional regulator with XRE-family HTH domain